MEPDGIARAERRLAAILAADVAGYSGLIEADEEGMLERLEVARQLRVDLKIAEHHWPHRQDRSRRHVGKNFRSSSMPCTARPKSGGRCPSRTPGAAGLLGARRPRMQL